MNIVELLSILIPTSVHKPHREVLEDFPGCGKLGDQEKRECFWGCQWVNNPYYEISTTDAIGVVLLDLKAVAFSVTSTGPMISQAVTLKR